MSEDPWRDADWFGPRSRGFLIGFIIGFTGMRLLFWLGLGI